VELGLAKPNFWHDYKWIDPVTKKVLEKSTYCQRNGDVLFCVGIYKR
jgi:cytochrome c